MSAPETKHERSAQQEIEAVLGLGGTGVGGARRGARWLLLLLLLVAAGGVALYLAARGPAERLTYRTDPARRADITVIVTATGTVQPTNTVEISSELSGIVRRVAVDYNSTVRAGAVLAELDTDRLKAAVDASRARVSAARARVAEAEATVVERQRDLERKQTLAERSIGSPQDLDASRAAYERAVASLASARADVDAAEADLKLNETNLDKSCICAPIDGIVLERNVEPGQVVAASLQAPVLFTIAEDLRKMEIRVDVDEADIGRVREGQSATFTVDAYPDRRFRADIRQVRFGSEVVQGVVTYKAVLTADNSELLLRPGMTATAEIVVEQATDALTVSNEALRFAPPVAETPADRRTFLERLLPGMPRFRPPARRVPAGPARDVWVLRDGIAESVAVMVGVSDGRRTQIVDGALEAGDAVIVDALATTR